MVHPTRWLRQGGYALVLLLLATTFVVIMVDGDTAWGRVASVALQGLTLVAVFEIAHARRLLLVIALCALAAGTLLALLLALTADPRFSGGVISLVGALLLVSAPVVIVRDVANSTCVTTQTILGAISVYVQFGIVFYLLLVAFERLAPGSVLTPGQVWVSNEYLFFSFTTLTTTGYGNLVPGGEWGQSLAMLEAMLGQIYLVVVVARLVSIWQPPKRA
jgi:hypothetical protein